MHWMRGPSSEFQQLFFFFYFLSSSSNCFLFSFLLFLATVGKDMTIIKPNRLVGWWLPPASQFPHTHTHTETETETQVGGRSGEESQLKTSLNIIKIRRSNSATTTIHSVSWTMTTTTTTTSIVFLDSFVYSPTYPPTRVPGCCAPVGPQIPFLLLPLLLFLQKSTTKYNKKKKKGSNENERKAATRHAQFSAIRTQPVRPRCRRLSS